MSDIYLELEETHKTIVAITKASRKYLLDKRKRKPAVQHNIEAPALKMIGTLLTLANRNMDTRAGKTIHRSIMDFLPFAENNVLSYVSTQLADLPPDLQLPYFRAMMKSEKFDFTMLNNVVENSGNYAESIKIFFRGQVLDKGFAFKLGRDELLDLRTRFNQISGLNNAQLIGCTV